MRFPSVATVPLLAAMVSSATISAGAWQKPSPAAPVRVVLVGDSTVTHKPSDASAESSVVPEKAETGVEAPTLEDQAWSVGQPVRDGRALEAGSNQRPWGEAPAGEPGSRRGARVPEIGSDEIRRPKVRAS